MATSPLKGQITSVSESLYHALLLLYPKQFRRVYAQEMTRTFRDCYRTERKESGTWGIARLWGLVLSDLVTSACIEHYKTFLTFLKLMLGIEKELFMANTLLNLDVALRTDIGITRASNEDNATSFVPQDPQVMSEKGALFVVADGLGGHTQGDVASELAVNAVRDAYYQSANEDIATALREAVEHANLLIYQKNTEAFEGGTPEELLKNGMGTTCVAAVLHDDKVYVANAGDSFAYLIRPNEMRQIAEDHSWIADQVRKGIMTQEEAEAQGKRNIIVRCLGGEPTVEVYVGSEPVQDGDILLLCTDGLWSQVSQDELRAIVEQFTPEESVARLIARANENGGTDNVAAVVVRVSLTQ
jgi:protein phosphatase